MRSRTQVLIAFFSAMAVTLVAVSDMGRTSPGGLSAVHQRVDDLSGRNDCSECHGGLFGSMRAACLECHAPIETQLAESRGLHGTLGARAEQCGLCHAEHHGATAPLVHGQSFALAGAPEAGKFDHRLIGFVLDGAHAGLECSQCHPNARKPVLAENETRFLGLDRDCASCHEDPHEGRYVIACAECHGQERWDALASLGHERVLPLIGGHAGFACAQCHAEEGAHRLDVLGGPGPKPEPRDCVACHESPHAPGFARGAAALAGLPPGQGCVSCHASDHASFHDPVLAALSEEQHAASGFELEAGHAGLECTACHAPAEAPFDERFPGRLAERCSVCHEDVHEGQFDAGAFAGKECGACHDLAHFEPHAFGPEKHALAALELTGRHLELDCEDCHARTSAGGARLFNGTPDACDACHADAHAAFFAPFLAGRVPPEHGECARCHDTTEFARAEAGFDHGTFTGFAVLGAHAESACTVCHEPRDEADETGRTFGRAGDRFGTRAEFERCATCHADPHDGRFDGRRHPASVEGSSGCARCHRETSFRTLRRDFDHGFWTGFALAGAHAEASCSACHAPIPGASRQGRTSAEAAGAGCGDCHEDPHARQFVDDLGFTKCERCHDSARDDFLSFDHEQDSRFPLGDAHRGLACGKCHASSAREGLAVVKYRPLEIRCVDCHGSNAEVLLRRLPRKK
jgi:hypothetical protein